MVAKISGERFDNRAPREWLGKQSNPRVHRANAAQLNAFEALPILVASILLAQLAGVPTSLIDILASVFVLARIMHGLFYVADRDKARSMVWFIGFACCIALIVMAIIETTGGS
jgi:uncharacterized MAPEG superfamily protein